jgi:hypothetical protein
VALSCAGKSNSYVGNEHGPGGTAGTTAGAGFSGTDAGAGASSVGGSSGGSVGSAGSTPNAGDAGKGGDSTSGAGGSSATAGTEQGGSAGSAGTPPLTECVRTMEQTVEGQYCIVAEQCPAKAFTVVCSPNNDDSWSCSCNGALFQVTGIDDEWICDTYIDVCIAEQEMPIVGECSYTVEDRTEDACELRRACVQPVPGSDGATMSSENYVRCSNAGVDEMLCKCNDNRMVSITGQTGLQACDTVIDNCTGDDTIDFEGDSSCTLGTETGDSAACFANASCERAKDLGGGVTATEVEEVRVTCQDVAGGGATCTCISSGVDGQAVFDIESSADASGVCSRYTALCGSVETTALSNEVECGLHTQYGSDDRAYIELDCTQPVSYEGERVVLHGGIWTECRKVEDVYHCGCQTADDLVSIDVQADDDWDAGTVAATECQNVVRPVIGNRVIRAPLPPAL